MGFKIAPLNSSFMVTAMLGFIISVVWVYDVSPSYGFAFAVVFAAMFIASVVSMTYADSMVELDMDKKKKSKKKKK